VRLIDDGVAHDPARFLRVSAGKLSYSEVGAIIGVRTSGMWIVVKRTPSRQVSA
jgi:hypothetical protein